mgnify:CR=1 FL=1
MSLNKADMEDSINERIKEIVDIQYKRNVSAAARDMGIKQTTLKGVVNGDVKPSYETIVRVLKSDWSRSKGGIKADWLLFGVGDMFANESSNPNPKPNFEKGRPYYDVDFECGFDIMFNDQTSVPAYLIDYPPFNKDGVFWCNATGRSMEPEINNGDVIVIQEVSNWREYIPFGETYAIATTNGFRTIKKIRKGKESDQFLLVPVNRAEYDEQEISKDAILKIYRVLASMKKF